MLKDEVLKSILIKPVALLDNFILSVWHMNQKRGANSSNDFSAVWDVVILDSCLLVLRKVFNDWPWRLV